MPNIGDELREFMGSKGAASDTPRPTRQQIAEDVMRALKKGDAAAFDSALHSYVEECGYVEKPAPAKRKPQR